MGEGFEIGVAKASTGSYRRRLEVQNSDTAKVAVDVVVNDEQMSAQAAVSDLWYRSDEPDVETTVHRDLNVAELAALFETATALVHYVGHVEERGVSCADGYLDARPFDDVGVRMFILNACTSSHQGKHLVDEGAIAGVVTLDAVPNETATRVGKDVARLVNFGFPVTNAIESYGRPSSLGRATSSSVTRPRVSHIRTHRSRT